MIQTGIKEIVIGVGFQQILVYDKLSKQTDWNVFIPPLSFTTDNAAMIAVAGFLNIKTTTSVSWIAKHNRNAFVMQQFYLSSLSTNDTEIHFDKMKADTF